MLFKKKKFRLGVSILCLLLLFTTCISFIDIKKQNNAVDKNSLSLSALDDNYEENDVNNTAYNLSNNESKWLSTINGFGNQSDDDWYKFDLQPGKERIVIDLNYTYMVNGKINIELYNSSDYLIGFNYSTNDKKYINVIVPGGGGIYKIKVFGDNNGSNPYNLRWNSTYIGSPLGSDRYEPNNDFWNASSLDPNMYKNLTILDTDNDWFKLNLTFGDILDVDIFFNNSDGNLQLELYEPSNTFKNGSYSSTDNESISLNITNPGAWRIRVYHAYGDSNVNYTLDIWVNAGMFDEDFLEPNENFTDARPIGPGFYYNLEIVGEDEDWFQLDLNIGDIIYVDIFFNNSEGNLQLELYNPSYSLRKWSYSSTYDYEYLQFNITISDYWRIRVYHEDKNSNVKYDLNINVDVEDDQYDDGGGNDYKGYAADITSMRGSWINELIQKDDDWYRIDTELGIFAELMRYGNIQMQLYNNFNSFPITGSFHRDGREIIDKNVLNGTYFIRVFGDNISNSYDLRWEDYSTRYPEEFHEPNNNYLSAYDISGPGNETLPHRGIQWNNDTFKIYAEEELHVDLNTMEQSTDLEIYYYNETIADIELIGGLWDWDSCLNIKVPWNGTYYIKVIGNNTGDRYELCWETFLLAQDDQDDHYDNPPNDFPWQASFFVPFAAMWIYDLIQLDDDWYQIRVDPGEERIYIELNFMHFPGQNIDVELYNMSSSFPIIGNYSLDDNEYIDVNVSAYGDYYIRVFGDNNSNKYDLWWEDLSPEDAPGGPGGAGGSDDYYEENDVDSDAYDLTNHEDEWISSLYTGIAFQFDDDWYVIDVKIDAGHLIVELNFDDFEGNIDLELYDESLILLASSNTRDNYEFVDIELQSSGKYFIRVFGNNSRNWYDLIWRTQEYAKDFYDDNYELNNEAHSAYSLIEHERKWISTIDGLAVQGDEDWYFIGITPGFQQLTVLLSFNRSNGDINIAIYRVNLPEIDDLEHLFLEKSLESFSNFNFDYVMGNDTDVDEISVEINDTIPGPYLIQIWGDDMGNEYNLWWDDIRTRFDDDEYERNNDNVNATDLTENDGEWLGYNSDFGVQYNEDWYEIETHDEQSRLLVFVLYDSAEGLLGFEIYDSDLTKLEGNFTRDDGDFINYVLRSNGTIYIKVFGDNSGNVYTMMWTTEEFVVNEVPGYDTFILLGSIFGIASIIAIKWKRRSKLHHKQ